MDVRDCCKDAAQDNVCCSHGANVCLWDALLCGPAPALGCVCGCKGWRLLTLQLRWDLCLQASFVTLDLSFLLSQRCEAEDQMHLRFASSTGSDDALHIGNYKLDATYGCFRADWCMWINSYDVCVSAACCGGNVHLMEASRPLGVVWLQGLESARTHLSFGVDHGLFTRELLCLDFVFCCCYAAVSGDQMHLGLSLKLVAVCRPGLVDLGQARCTLELQTWCRQWLLQRRQLFNALRFQDVALDCTSLLLVETGLSTTGSFLSDHRE